jgi:hypothetical protein
MADKVAYMIDGILQGPNGSGWDDGTAGGSGPPNILPAPLRCYTGAGNSGGAGAGDASGESPALSSGSDSSTGSVEDVSDDDTPPDETDESSNGVSDDSDYQNSTSDDDNTDTSTSDGADPTGESSPIDNNSSWQDDVSGWAQRANTVLGSYIDALQWINVSATPPNTMDSSGNELQVLDNPSPTDVADQGTTVAAPAFQVEKATCQACAGPEVTNQSDFSQLPSQDLQLQPGDTLDPVDNIYKDAWGIPVPGQIRINKVTGEITQYVVIDAQTQDWVPLGDQSGDSVVQNTLNYTPSFKDILTKMYDGIPDPTSSDLNNYLNEHWGQKVWEIDPSSDATSSGGMAASDGGGPDGGLGGVGGLDSGLEDGGGLGDGWGDGLGDEDPGVLGLGGAATQPDWLPTIVTTSAPPTAPVVVSVDQPPKVPGGGFGERADRSDFARIERAIATSLANIPNTLVRGVVYTGLGLEGHVKLVPHYSEDGTIYKSELDDYGQKQLASTESWRIQPPPGSEQLSQGYDFAVPLVVGAAAGGIPEAGAEPGSGALFSDPKETVSVVGAEASDATASGTVAAAPRTLEELLQPGGRLIGKPGGARGGSPDVRQLPGGLAAAQNMFNELSAGGDVVPNPRYTGIQVKLPGGGTIGLRTTSTRSLNGVNTEATIDVNVPGLENIRKLKF